jgi:hypothetical protein
MPSMSRLCLFLLAFVFSSLASAAERKPNFVYVFTDDQRRDALGVVQREQGG